MFEIIPEFFRNIFLVFTFGGFIPLSAKIYEWYLDRYMNVRGGEWKGGLDYVVLRIYPPEENNRSLGEMEGLFINLGSIYEKISKKDVFLKGRWYEGISLEIHSDGGKVAYYTRINRWYLKMFRASFETHFPGTQITEVEDPCSKWTPSWENNELFSDMFGADIDYTNHDVHPTRSWKTFQKDNLPPTNDPINQIISLIEHIKEDEYAIFKVTIRPFEDSKKRDEMIQEIDGFRQELMGNAIVDTGGNGRIQVLTEEEKFVINSALTKSANEHFKTKIRFGFFTNGIKPGSWEGHINGYFQQFNTIAQTLECSQQTRTNKDEEGDNYKLPIINHPVIAAFAARFLDKFFWERERFYRKYKIYQALLSRESVDIGETPRYMDAPSLAAFFHLPTTHDEISDLNYRITSGYGEADTTASSAAAPINLPG